MRLVPLRDLIDEFARHIQAQLDFEAEAENQRQFVRMFAGNDQVKIPRLIDHLCTGTVLTMECLEGLEKTPALSLSRSEREKAARVGLRALYHMVFIEGLVHADLHPGNIFFRPGGEVVLLDMGLVARLNEEDRHSFADFFLGMASNDGRRCAGIVRDAATYRGRNWDPQGFDEAIVQLVAEFSLKNAADFEVTDFAIRLFDAQRRFGLRGSTAFTMTILSFVVFQGIVKQLHPALDFQEEARRFFVAVHSRSVAASSVPPT